MVIRNQQGASPPSADGELVIVLVASSGQVVDQQPVRFTTADAISANLLVGRCTVIARHPSFNLTEARQDVMLSEKVMLGGKYLYLKSER